ncbi:MAG: hypothetical protein RLZ37_1460, partial [Actinomycetota bacterium]
CAQKFGSDNAKAPIQVSSWAYDSHEGASFVTVEQRCVTRKLLERGRFGVDDSCSSRKS